MFAFFNPVFQAEADCNVSEASPHIANIGRMVEVSVQSNPSILDQLNPAILDQLNPAILDQLNLAILTSWSVAWSSMAVWRQPMNALKPIYSYI